MAPVVFNFYHSPRPFHYADGALKAISDITLSHQINKNWCSLSFFIIILLRYDNLLLE